MVYGAISGKSPLSLMRAILHGKNPGSVSATQSITGSGGIGASTIPIAGGPPGAGQYNTASLRQLWMQAGGSASSANNAACHGMQESSGNPKVTSSNPDGGINVGLWQLDTNGVGAGHTVAELQNPLLNARITVQATNDGQNWSEWATPGC